MPGVGPRSAERIALWMVQSRNDQPEQIAGAISKTRAQIHPCKLCGFFATNALHTVPLTLMVYAFKPKDRGFNFLEFLIINQVAGLLDVLPIIWGSIAVLSAPTSACATSGAADPASMPGR